MGTLDLRFEYIIPKKAVYDWLTDLSPRGYVGRALRSIRIIGEEDGKMVVETRWKDKPQIATQFKLFPEEFYSRLPKGIDEIGIGQVIRPPFREWRSPSAKT